MVLNDLDVLQMQVVENAMLPNRATIMVSGRTTNSSGNTIYTFTPSAYSVPDEVPCRVAAGMPRSEEIRFGDTLALVQVWTVVFEAGTSIKNADRVWIKDWPKPLTVQGIADGGDFETAVVVVCAEALK